ncbi:MAG: hypothetical protein ACRDIU_00165 [Actinomycetota bacterium]
MTVLLLIPGMGPAWAAPAISVSNAGSVLEGDLGDVPGHQLVFTVTLSAPSTTPVTVHYRVYPSSLSGNLTLEDNYLAVTAAPIVFAPGDTSEQFTVDIVADNVAEDDLVVIANIYDASGATLPDTDCSGVAYGATERCGTIVDDD